MRNPDDLLVAHHEAGHAVIARALGVGVTHVSLFPTDAGGTAGAQTRSAHWVAPANNPSAQIAAYEADAKVALAGPMAQHHYRPGKPRWKHEWRDDLVNAKSFVGRSVLLQQGIQLSGDPQAVTLTPEQLATINEQLNRVLAEATALVEEHWPTIERVARVLLEHRILSDFELDALIADRPVLPWH
jgi:hypothetical protein